VAPDENLVAPFWKKVAPGRKKVAPFGKEVAPGEYLMPWSFISRHFFYPFFSCHY
jgi:hypothetical protein